MLRATSDTAVIQIALKIFFFFIFIVLMITKIRKNKRPLYGFLFPVTGAFLLLIIAIMVASTIKINKRKSELSNRIEVLKKEIEILEEKNSQLKASIDQTQGQDYTEQVLRENLNYKKPGEDVVVVKAATDTADTEGNGLQEKSFWQKIKEKLGF